jgi:hypothetical protein
MARFHVPFFEGLVLKKEPLLLKDTESLSCENVRLDRGHLRGWNIPLVTTDIVGDATSTLDTPTLYRWDRTESATLGPLGNTAQYLFWDKVVNVVPTPVIEDEHDRVYYTGDGEPRYTYKTTGSTTHWDLGVPAPGNAPSGARLGQGSATAADAFIRHYAYSFAYMDNGVEYEGPLSPVSATAYSTGDEDSLDMVFSQHPTVVGTYDDTASKDSQWVINPTTYRKIYRLGTDNVQTLTQPSTVSVDTAHVLGSTQANITFSINFYSDLVAIEHIVTPGDYLTFVYNGQIYTTSPLGTTTIAGLFKALESATATVGGVAITLGTGVLNPSYEISEDGLTLTVVIEAYGSNAISLGKWYDATSYYHLADLNVGALTFTDDVPVANLTAATAYVYPTGGTAPSSWVTRDGNVISKPVSAPVLVNSVIPAVATDTDAEASRYYVYTYVTPLGEEGPPSPVSPELIAYESESVGVTFSTDNLGSYNLATGARRRIYRTATGTTSTDFQFVGEQDIANLYFVDNKATAQLGEVLPSVTWDPPPRTGDKIGGALQGITTAGNGFLAGFVGSTLCFSEQFIPSAWPISFRMSFDSTIVGLGVAGNSLVVLTDSYPFLVSGSTPQEMTAVRVESAQACVSARSIVDMGELVAYASPDGLVAVSEAGVDVITKEVLTRDQWQGYEPSDMFGLYYEGHYLGFNPDQGTSIVVNPDGGVSELAAYGSADILAGFTDYYEDSLLLLDRTGEVSVFSSGATLMSVTWKSKPFKANKPVGISVVQVHVEEESMTLDLFGDDNKVGETLTFPVGLTEQRVPGVLADEWRFEISGSGVVKFVTMASVMDELRNE